MSVSPTRFAPAAPAPRALPSQAFAALAADAPSVGNLEDMRFRPPGLLVSTLFAAGTAAGAYHGYKRTGSVGWALGWAIAGGVAPIITLPIALAQGFAKPARR